MLSGSNPLSSPFTSITEHQTTPFDQEAKAKKDALSRVHFDAEDVHRFLETIFKSSSGFIELLTLDPQTEKARRISFTSRDEAQEEIRIAAEKGLNVSVGIASRKASCSGTKQNLQESAALWVDLDCSPEEAQAASLGNFPPASSLTVRSGNGVHYYWLLKEPFNLESADSRDRFEAVLRGLTRSLGADPAATDSSRVMRVPGTTNHPSEKKRKLGRIARQASIIELNNNLYAFADFAAWEALGADLTPLFPPFLVTILQR